MPTPIRSAELVPGLHEPLCEQRMKIFLEIAFSHQIRQPGRCAGQGLFPNCDLELMNFLAIVTNHALDDCGRNPGFV